jgi:hypothetical protein
MLRVPLAHAAYREMDLHISTDRMIAYFRCHHRAWYEQHGLQPLLSLLPLLRPLQLWIERVRRHSHFSIKGTLPYPKPTPSENPRRKLKNSKTQNPHVLAVSMQGASSGKKEKRKNCGFGQPESLLRRRRVRFGKWTIPLRTHLDL